MQSYLGLHCLLKAYLKRMVFGDKVNDILCQYFIKPYLKALFGGKECQFESYKQHCEKTFLWCGLSGPSQQQRLVRNVKCGI